MFRYDFIEYILVSFRLQSSLNSDLITNTTVLNVAFGVSTSTASYT